MGRRASRDTQTIPLREILKGIRLPVAPPGRPHGGRKGAKGYRRKRDRKIEDDL